MARWRTIDFKCVNEKCNHFEILLLDLEDKTELDGSDSPRSPRKCPICEEEAFYRQLKMPSNTKASFVDGTKRKGWSDIKEAAKLKREAAVSRGDKRKEIAAEIRKMGVKPGRDGV